MAEISPDLRPLTAEEAALTEAHPLPDGTPDAMVNKALLGSTTKCSNGYPTQPLACATPKMTAFTNRKSWPDIAQ